MHLILGEKNTHKNFNKKLSNTFQIKTKDYKLILKRLYHRLTQILTFNAHNIYSQSDSVIKLRTQAFDIFPNTYCSATKSKNHHFLFLNMLNTAKMEIIIDIV